MTKITLQILNRNYLLSCYYKELISNNDNEGINKLIDHLPTFDYYLFMSFSVLFLVKDLVYRWEYNGKKYMKEKLINKISLSLIDKLSSNSYDYFLNSIKDIDETIEIILIAKMIENENEIKNAKLSEPENDIEIKKKDKSQEKNKTRQIKSNIDTFENIYENNNKRQKNKKNYYEYNSSSSESDSSLHNEKNKNKKFENDKFKERINLKNKTKKNKIDKAVKLSEDNDSDSGLVISLDETDGEMSRSSSNNKKITKKGLPKTSERSKKEDNLEEQNIIEKMEKRNVITRKFNQVKNFENDSNAVCMICFKKNPNQICSVCFNSVHIKCINSKVASYVWVCDDCKNI